MKRGRPRKAGRRTEGGRLKRNNYPTPIYDRGSDWVQAMRTDYGEHYSSALGRAYAKGLLGDGDDGKRRLDAGKRFAIIHDRFYGGDIYTSPLDDSVRGENVVELTVSDQQRHDREWLRAKEKALDEAGVRPWLDQLLSRLHTDAGPYWLDALLKGGKHPADLAVLKAAIQALDLIAPEIRSGIRVAYY